jgi:hypothetical protein
MFHRLLLTSHEQQDLPAVIVLLAAHSLHTLVTMLRVACGAALNTLQHTALPAAAVAGNLLLRHGQAWTLQQQLQSSLLARFSGNAAELNSKSSQVGYVDEAPVQAS